MIEVLNQNFGKFIGFKNRTYDFDKIKIFLVLKTKCCDYWDRTGVKTPTTYVFDNVTYHRKNFKSMIGINIHTVLIDVNDKKETGEVIMLGEGFFNIQKFEHHHNGYYPSTFKYKLSYKVSYSDLIDESSDDSSDEDEDADW